MDHTTIPNISNILKSYLPASKFYVLRYTLNIHKIAKRSVQRSHQIAQLMHVDICWKR